MKAQLLTHSIFYSLKKTKIRDVYVKLFEALLKRDRQFRDAEALQLAYPQGQFGRVQQLCGGEGAGD